MLRAIGAQIRSTSIQPHKCMELMHVFRSYVTWRDYLNLAIGFFECLATNWALKKRKRVTDRVCVSIILREPERSNSCDAINGSSTRQCQFWIVTKNNSTLGCFCVPSWKSSTGRLFAACEVKISEFQNSKHSNLLDFVSM